MIQPEWLVPGARVRVRNRHKSHHSYVLTVRAVEWPWLVHFEGQPGGMHPRNVLALQPPPCENALSIPEI